VLPEQPEVGRHAHGREIGQEDMKELMIEVVNRTYLYLSVIFANKASAEIIEYLEEHDPVPNWDEPEMPDDVLKDAKRHVGAYVVPDVVPDVERGRSRRNFRSAVLNNSRWR
jgi:hypothetical protein